MIPAVNKDQFGRMPRITVWQWPHLPTQQEAPQPKEPFLNPWCLCIRLPVCKSPYTLLPPPPSPPPTRLRIIKAAVLAIATGSTPDDDDGSGNASSPLLPAGGGLRPGEERVPPHLEVAHIPYEQGGPYPGLFLFTQAARMARPVKQVCVGAGVRGRCEANRCRPP